MTLSQALLARKLTKAGYDLGEYYASALDEIRDEKTVPALWAAAFTDAKGNEDRAKAEYVRMRGLALCQSDYDAECLRRHELQNQQKADRVRQKRPPWACVVCGRNYDGAVDSCPQCGSDRP